MVYNPQKHHRRSIRLKNYDYTQDGLYFITLCVHQRIWLFGEINNSEMVLNTFGKIAAAFWRDIPDHFPNTNIRDYVIMPNHIHGIIQIIGSQEDNCKDTACRVPTPVPTATEGFSKPQKGSIPTIIRSYKSAVTRQINETRRTPGAMVWQRNYYEHVIRNEKEFYSILQYIRNNPLKWQQDRLFSD